MLKILYAKKFLWLLSGKLHRHIVQLQISEGTAVQKLESALQKVSKLEAQVLRLEQQIDEKNQSIYHNRNEAQNKIKHLKRNLFVSFCIFSLLNIHIFLGFFVWNRILLFLVNLYFIICYKSYSFINLKFILNSGYIIFSLIFICCIFFFIYIRIL